MSQLATTLSQNIVILRTTRRGKFFNEISQLYLKCKFALDVCFSRFYRSHLSRLDRHERRRSGEPPLKEASEGGRIKMKAPGKKFTLTRVFPVTIGYLGYAARFSDRYQTRAKGIFIASDRTKGSALGLIDDV